MKIKRFIFSREPQLIFSTLQIFYILLTFLGNTTKSKCSRNFSCRFSTKLIWKWQVNFIILKLSTKIVLSKIYLLRKLETKYEFQKGLLASILCIIKRYDGMKVSLWQTNYVKITKSIDLLTRLLILFVVNCCYVCNVEGWKL